MMREMCATRGIYCPSVGTPLTLRVCARDLFPAPECLDKTLIRRIAFGGSRAPRSHLDNLGTKRRHLQRHHPSIHLLSFRGVLKCLLPASAEIYEFICPSS